MIGQVISSIVTETFGFDSLSSRMHSRPTQLLEGDGVLASQLHGAEAFYCVFHGAVSMAIPALKWQDLQDPSVFSQCLQVAFKPKAAPKTMLQLLKVHKPCRKSSLLKCLKLGPNLHRSTTAPGQQ